MRKHRDLVGEGAIAPREFPIDRGEVGRQFVGGDVADAGHAPYPPRLVGNNCWISGWPIAGLIASNRPVALISRATWRVVANAISVIWVAVVTRATPSASSSATLG